MDIPVRVIINAVNNASKEFRSLSGDLGDVGVDLKKVAIAGAALGAATGLLTKDLINQAGAMEQNEVAFRTMLGSAEAATKLLAQIRDFAKATPFNLSELVEGSKRLLAYNVEAKDLIPTLNVLGDITAGVGREKLPQLILAFGQVKAATHLTGAELRQFSEAGVPLLQTLADQAGVTAATMVEKIGNSEVTFEDVSKALASMTQEGGKFHNLMQQQSTTTLGKISNMEDSIQQLKVTLGNALLPTVNRNLDRLIPLVEQFAAWAAENPKVVDSVIRVGLAIGTLSSAFLVLSPAVKGIIVTFKALQVLAGAMQLGPILGGVLTFLTGPIGIAILAIAGAIAFVALAWKNNWLNIHETAQSNINTLVSIFNFFKGIVETVSNAVVGYIQYQIDQFNAFVSVGRTVVEGVVAFLESIPGTVENFVNSVVSFIQSVPERVSSFLKSAADSLYNFFVVQVPYAYGVAYQSFINFVTIDIPNAWGQLVQFFTESLPQMAEQFIGSIADMLTQAAQTFYLWATVDVPNAISAFITWASVAIPQFAESFKAWISNMATQTYQAIVKWQADQAAQFEAFKKQAIQKATETYTSVVAWIKQLVTDVTTSINELPGNIVAAMEKVKTAAIDKAREIYEGVKGWFDKIVGFFNDIIGKASEAINKSREAFAQGRDDTKRQFGGPVSSATQYLVGEKGPELFVPQTAGNIIPNNQLGGGGGGGPTIQFIINSDMIINSPQERRSLAEALYRDLVTLARAHNMTVSELLGG